MAIDVQTLSEKSTTYLEGLRENYRAQRRNLPRMHRSRGRSNTLSTDTRRCDDAIRMITNILRSRARANTRKPLKEFQSP